MQNYRTCAEIESKRYRTTDDARRQESSNECETIMFEIKTRDVEFGIEKPVRPGKKKITFNKIKFASKKKK
jgi:hypothetical protein